MFEYINHSVFKTQVKHTQKKLVNRNNCISYAKKIAQSMLRNKEAS